MIVFVKLSKPEITVAPVVVNPDMDSKKASEKPIFRISEVMKGIVANNERINQKLTTTIIPSRILNSDDESRNGK
jgi:hypothetical protein